MSAGKCLPHIFYLVSFRFDQAARWLFVLISVVINASTDVAVAETPHFTERKLSFTTKIIVLSLSSVIRMQDITATLFRNSRFILFICLFFFIADRYNCLALQPPYQINNNGAFCYIHN